MTEIRLLLKEADAIAAYRLYWTVVMRRRWVHIWLPLAIIFISLFYGTGYRASAVETVATVAELAGVGIAAIALICSIAYFILVPRRARRSFRQNHMLREEMLLTVDDEALHVVQASARGRRQWTTFRSWAENKRTLLLLSTDQLFFFLPKLALTADDLVAMHACLARAGVKRARTLSFSGR